MAFLSQKTGQYWREAKRREYFPKKKNGNGQPRRPKLGPEWKKNFIKTGAAGLILCFLFGAAGVAWLSRGLPDPNRLIDREVAQSTKILDRTGETVLYEVHGDEKRTIVDLKEIPDYVKQATIAIEDKDFYEHGGFSLWAIFRTVVTNVFFGKKAGGSTLTQQFVKNSILTNEKTYTRKLKELVLAYRLEKKFSKDEILQMYFNEIPYGSTAYGVEAASQRYFGKSVRQVNLAEAAILAALPQAPSRYSPYGSRKDLLLARQHYILDLMVKYGYIDPKKAGLAKDYKLEFKEPTEKILAPHFVMYVKEQLAEKYGDKAVEQGGLKITTTLDLFKQQAAEETIREAAEKNKKNYQARNAALVTVDPKTGQILAMVGSCDYFDEKNDGQVNVATSLRQPGSSIKPIVYAAAFLKGYTPNTILYDVVTNFSADPAKKYKPHNYDSKEHGPVSMRKALAGSLNIPAVKTIYLAGIDKVLDLARDLGYTTLNDKDRFGLSLVLGGGEVKLIEHVNAYSAFARDGEKHELASILKVEDKNGKVLEEYKDIKKKVVDANVARMVNDVMSDNGARAFIFGEKNWLTLGSRPVAAKTGTTNDYRDAWTIGFTPSLITGVWVGNNDNSAMKRGADGSQVAAPIWNKYMKRVLGDTPIEYFKKPDIPKTGKPVLDGESGIDNKIKIDRASGLLATELTPLSFVEEKTFAQPHTILYYINKNNPRGDAPKNPAADPQFNLWEAPILAWAAKQNLSSSTPPKESDNLHIPENRPVLSMASFSNNQIVADADLNLAVNATAPRGISRIEYYLNNNLLAVNATAPFDLNKNISFLKNGYHSLLIKACDDIDNCAEENFNFNFTAGATAGAADIGLSWNTILKEIEAASSSFPLVFFLNLANQEQIAKINLYYSAAGRNEKKIISSFSSLKNNPLSVSWPVAPPPGAYEFFAEASGWNGQTTQTNTIKISIK